MNEETAEMESSNLLPVEPWLELLWEHHGSDLLLAGGSPPRVRIDGSLIPVPGAAVLSGNRIDEFVRSLLNPDLIEVFDESRDVDFGVSWKDRARLRCSAFTQKGETALAMRMIPDRIPNFEELGLPETVIEISNLSQGFVLLVGPTGSGKSTTLAAMIDRINETRSANILTIEDPIEYIHFHKRSAVLQREIGLDSPSFARALRAALREDPDVLLIGEMRDTESMQIALTLAETGHLVFATLHTNDATQTIDRVINAFPAERQDMIRMQMAASFAAVVSQRLVPRIGGGRVAAFEILLATNSVRHLIREGRSDQLQNILRTSQKVGMQTLESCLVELVRSGTVSLESARTVSSRPDEIDRGLEQYGEARV
jgi:twitching motility protein PilT